MIFFKNKFAKILLLLLIEFKIDTLLPSVTVKLRCERWGGGGSRIGIPPRSIIFTPDWRWAPLPRSQSSARDVSLFMRHRVNTISTGLCRIRIRGRRRRRKEEKKKISL